jgi:integrase
MKTIELPNGCKASQPAVNPKNWKERNADMSKDWQISYRFTDEHGKVKQVSVRGMNDMKKRQQRKEITKFQLEKILEDLKGGYNPITNKTVPLSNDSTVNMNRYSSLIDALWFAHQQMKATLKYETWKDIEGVLNTVQAACNTGNLVISKTTRKDVLRMLNEVGEHIKKQPAVQLKKGERDTDSIPRREWTNNNYNRYRRYLSSCFSVCIDQELIDLNPIDKRLRKRPVIKEEERLTLTREERKRVKEHLKTNHPSFYRYVQIFFHSGGRSTELLNMQGKDVYLYDGIFKVLVKKGGQWIKVKKAIKNIALEFWVDAMKDCKPNDYVFSIGLVPGQKKITPSKITERWRIHVKEKLGIQADFYSLKHLNLDEVADKLDIQLSKKMASHTSNKTTELYAKNEKDRVLARLQLVDNEF